MISLRVTVLAMFALVALLSLGEAPGASSNQPPPQKRIGMTNEYLKPIDFGNIGGKNWACEKGFLNRMPPKQPTGDLDGDGTKESWASDKIEIGKDGTKVQIWCVTTRDAPQPPATLGAINFPFYVLRVTQPNGDTKIVGGCGFEKGTNKPYKQYRDNSMPGNQMFDNNVDDILALLWENENDPVAPDRKNEFIYDIVNDKLNKTIWKKTGRDRRGVPIGEYEEVLPRPPQGRTPPKNLTNPQTIFNDLFAAAPGPASPDGYCTDNSFQPGTVAVNFSASPSFAVAGQSVTYSGAFVRIGDVPEVLNGHIRLTSPSDPQYDITYDIGSFGPSDPDDYSFTAPIPSTFPIGEYEALVWAQTKPSDDPDVNLAVGATETIRVRSATLGGVAAFPDQASGLPQEVARSPRPKQSPAGLIAVAAAAVLAVMAVSAWYAWRRAAGR